MSQKMRFISKSGFRFHKNIIFILMLITLFINSCFAEDRALIIGITEYKHPKFNLKGIDLDVNMANEIAQMLSFNPDQIKVLTGTQASAANIKYYFNKWLVDGVKANDRVFVYFSGHGGFKADTSGDESDNKDEFITAYDTPLSLNGEGIIVDDELSQWIKNIPSKHKIIMLDSCHSGTATRGIKVNSHKLNNNMAYPKIIYLETNQNYTAPVKTTNPNLKKTSHSGFIDGAKDLITLAAAQDWEYALATQDGSIFTLGVYKALSQAAQNGSAITPTQAVEFAGDFIASAYAHDPTKIHTPIIFGDKKLASQAFKIKVSRNGQGPTWQKFQALSKVSLPMQAQANKTSFLQGELINFLVDIPIDGYLNIVNIDAHDAGLVLFPNKFNQDNKITKGRLSVPGNLMPFEIEASLPKGNSLTVFIVTNNPLNLYQNALNVRNSNGKFVKTFAEVSPVSYRSMKIRAKEQKEQTYSTTIITTVQ